MKTNRSVLAAVVVGALIAAASCPAQAAIITYTDRNAFLAALSSSSTDNYNDLNDNQFYASPLNRGITDYTYDLTASEGLFVGTVNGSKVLSTNGLGILTLAFTAGAPTAVGGYFYNTDIDFNVINGVITVTASPGASTQTAVTASATNFFGWLDDGGTPFTSLVITPGAGGYATVDDLILGQAPPASVPGPLPLLGAAAAFRLSRRLRSRIATARPRV
jgi:hypothetical protein